MLNNEILLLTRHDGPDWTSSLRCTKASNSILTDNPSRGQGKKLFPGWFVILYVKHFLFINVVLNSIFVRN